MIQGLPSLKDPQHLTLQVHCRNRTAHFFSFLFKTLFRSSSSDLFSTSFFLALLPFLLFTPPPLLFLTALIYPVQLSSPQLALRPLDDYELRG